MPISQKSIDKMYQITTGSPCETPQRCSQWDFCKLYGNECMVFKKWLEHDQRKNHRARTPSHLASDVRTGSDRKVERILKELRK